MGDGASSASASSASGDSATNTDAEITLGVLTSVEGNSTLSQRALARQLGIALGLANAYLKRCAKKGFIKIKQIPPNRYAYYLTPKGFSEKSRLTVEYLSYSLSFFRQARTQCAERFAECARRGWRRVALVGAGELAEIAALCAREAPVKLAGVIAPAGDRVAGLRVVFDIAELGGVDAVLITDVSAPQKTYDEVASAFPAERILTPRILNIAREAPAGRPAKRKRK